MQRSSDTPVYPGVAVIVFESPMLQQLIEAVGDLGFKPLAFDDAKEALAHIQQPQAPVSVVIANGSLPGVLNGSDLATRLSQAYPTLPLVVADHFEGLVANNVMCLDTPWTIEDIEDTVRLMIARLPFGKPVSRDQV